MWKQQPEAGEGAGDAHAPKRNEIESCRHLVREARQRIDYEV
jgi:hypothetical protein